MSESKSSRNIAVLDGLRGLAMIFVFLAHTGGRSYGVELPALLHPLWNTIVGSGGTGVSLLFMLSGFLHGHLYPVVADYGTFVRKRYFRIFPLFASIVASQLVFYLVPSLAWYLRLGVVLGMVLLMRLAIEWGRKMNIGKMVFGGFIMLQISTFVWYILASLEVFILPDTHITKALSVFMVNLTLTRFAGTTIRNLDGVYWSLVSEVLFYVLYPILFLPVSQLLTQSKSTLHFVGKSMVVSGACYALYTLTANILGLRSLNSTYFMFFVWGMVIAHAYRAQWWGSIAAPLASQYRKMQSWGTVIFLLITLGIIHHAAYYLEQYGALIRLLSGMLLAPLFIMIMYDKGVLKQIFTSRVLVSIGRVSYSIFLTHTVVIGMVRAYFTPHTPHEYIAFITISFSITCLLSQATWSLLERQYYQTRQ